MARRPTPVEIGKGRDPGALQYCLANRAAMPRPSMVLAGAYLALLSSCAPTLPARPPIAEAPPKPASEQPAAPTIADRAARRDAIIGLQEQSTPRPSSTVPTGGDYKDGYPVLAPPPKARTDGSLQSFLALDTGPYLANHNVHNLTWTNTSRRQLAIYKAYLWTGVDKGAIADVHIEARRASDNSYIGILQWDHYADPTLPQHGQQFDYPSPMMLDPGDSITIKHLANGFTPGWHAHHFLILWVK
jgi:hypothetical protein